MGRITLPNVVRRRAYRKLLELKIQKNPTDEIAERFRREHGISPQTVKSWWLGCCMINVSQHFTPTRSASFGYLGSPKLRTTPP